MNLKMTLLRALGILLVAALLLPVLPAGEVRASDPPTEIWVDATYNDTTPGWGVTHYATIQNGVDAVAEGGTVHVLAGTYNEEVSIAKSLTTVLRDGVTVAGTTEGMRCFTVAANYVRITGESPGGAVCRPDLEHGIFVNAGITNLIIEKLEIDGETAHNGIHFEGGITDVDIVDNYIHDALGKWVYHSSAYWYQDHGDGIRFVVPPSGSVQIKGNLFQDNYRVGVEAPADLDVRYNAWGHYDGPTAGDGISVNITNYIPWTHVDMYLDWVEPEGEIKNSRYEDEVAVSEEITYAVMANLQEAFGAEFTLTFIPSNLQVVKAENGSVFTFADPGLAPVTYDNVAGTITYNAGSTIVQSGEDLVLFTVTFEGTAATSEANPVDFSETEPAYFGMNPGEGPSLNIYPTDLVGITDLNVYALPTLDADPITGYTIDKSGQFTLTITNPTNGRDYNDLVVFMDVPVSATLKVWNGTAFVDYNSVDGVIVSELLAGAEAYDILFEITFPTVGTFDLDVDLFDDTTLLVEETFQFNVEAATVTGSVQMQGRTARAGVTVRLFNDTGGIYLDTESDFNITGNFTFDNVAAGTYFITFEQHRYLDIVITGSPPFYSGKTVTVAGNVDLPRLELRGGDLNDDRVVNIQDASMVGANYGYPFVVDTTDAGDANFDGKVNIFDLAMVGGNWNLQSNDPSMANYAYDAWIP